MHDYKTADRGEPEFPHKLGGTWPSRLYYRGHIETRGSCVAIVGARAASREAMETAESLASGLAGAGISVISGGALGVDTAAHRGVLRGAGHTIVVLACGIDQYYPKRNRLIFEAVLSSGGGVLTPFEVGCPPKRWHFVRRNRIIAGLSDLVLVVEAGVASGSLHTAGFAIEAGVPVAACSGSPGCEALLSRGAAVVADAGDVIDILAGNKRQRSVTLPAPGTPEAQVIAALGLKPVELDSLCSQTGLPVRELSRILLGLELSSLVLTLPGLRYQLSPLAME